MGFQIAQINIGRMLAPIDDPVMKEFVDNLANVNAVAEASPGFVWRLQSDAGNATDIAYSDDPFVIVNMSVWTSIEALKEFTYKSHHLEIFRKRAQWFERMAAPSYTLWWIPEGHIPTVAEAKERLEHYQKHGSTEFSFWFSQPFPAPELVSVNGDA
jgi:hypothetical protein